MNAAPETAYFDLPARLWEFSLGSFIALLPAIAVKVVAAHAMFIIGPVLLVSAGVVLPVESLFPGPATLWALTAAILVVIAARSQATKRNAFASEPLRRTLPTPMRCTWSTGRSWC